MDGAARNVIHRYSPGRIHEPHFRGTFWHRPTQLDTLQEQLIHRGFSCVALSHSYVLTHHTACPMSWIVRGKAGSAPASSLGDNPFWDFY